MIGRKRKVNKPIIVGNSREDCIEDYALVSIELLSNMEHSGGLLAFLAIPLSYIIRFNIHCMKKFRRRQKPY